LAGTVLPASTQPAYLAERRAFATQTDAHFGNTTAGFVGVFVGVGDTDTDGAVVVGTGGVVSFAEPQETDSAPTVTSTATWRILMLRKATATPPPEP
jgi:hypothetical protein